MAACTTGKIFGSLGLVFQQRINSQLLCPLLQVREYAARKGTRERREKLKKKRKVEVKKVGWVSPGLRAKRTTTIKLDAVKQDDSRKSTAIDDVWLSKYHKRRVFSFEEAVQCHKELNHPTVYDAPNAFINAFIELDMTGTKPTKPVETFARSVDITKLFDHGEKRTVLAFAKNPEYLIEAEKAGASLTGNTELIHKIQSGEIPVDDYQYVVAHPEILADLSLIRGLLKRKYPNPRMGTLGLDLAAMIRKVLFGIKYHVTLHPQQSLFGLITVPIGRLPMDWQDLEENFKLIVQDVNKMRPKREGPFIWRTSLTSPPSKEVLKVEYEPYLDEAPKDVDSDSDEEEEESARA